jgi:peroxiredoxin (alkyl hydroperoxide reductase subunit C)
VSVRLRRTTPDDAALVAETLALCYATYSEWAPGWSLPTGDEHEEMLASRLASPEVWSVIAFDGDEVAGHASLAERTPSQYTPAPPGHVKLWHLFVRPRWQGSGLATRLLRAVERETIERGWNRMALWTPRDHLRARGFYEREGWTLSGREQPDSPMRLPLVEYVRQLLPVPEDDGAADGLPGSRLPDVALAASDGSEVTLAALPGRTVVFAYPRTGTPGEEPLGGTESWNAIPGARGCTPQACAIRDGHARFEALGVRVFGLSTQTLEGQREAAERLHLPYPLLSDERAALGLPTFEVEGVTLYRRLTLVLRDGLVEDVVYPVFPPDEAAEQALERLRR